MGSHPCGYIVFTTDCVIIVWLLQEVTSSMEISTGFIYAIVD